MPEQVSSWTAAFETSLSNALNLLLAAIPQIVGFLLVISFGWFIASVATRAVTALLGRARFNDWVHRSGIGAALGGAGVDTDAIGLVALTAKWFIRLIALVVAFPTGSLALVLAAALLGGVGHGMAFLGAQADLNAIAPPERRGEVTAAFFMCIYLGVAVSAIGTGLVASATSLETAVVVFSCVTGFACVGAIAWHVAVARGRGVPLARRR